MSIQSTKVNNDISTVVKGSSFAFVGEMGRYGINLAYGLFVARTLPSDQLGLFFLALTLIKVLTILSVLGLQKGVIRYVAIYLSQKDRARLLGTVRLACAAVFFLSTFLALSLFLTAEWLTLYIFEKPGLDIALRWFAASLPFSALALLFYSALQGVKDIKNKMLSEIAVSLGLQICLTVLFLNLGFGLQALLSAYFFSQVAGFSISCYFFWKHLPLIGNGLPPAIYEGRTLFSFSLPLLLTTFFNLLLGQNEVLILGLYVSANEIAIYTIALKLALVGAIFLRSFTMIFSPMISELASKENEQRLAGLSKVITKWIFTFNFAWFIFFVFFSNHILSFVGNEYVDGRTTLIILCLGQLINSVAGPVGQLLMMSGYSKLVLFNSSLFLISSLALNFILIPRYGIEGAAVANAATVISTNLLMLIEVFIVFKIHPYDRSYRKPLLAGLLAIACTFWVASRFASSSFLSLLMLALLFGTVYFVSLYIQGLSKEDLMVLQAISKRLPLRSRA